MKTVPHRIRYGIPVILLVLFFSVLVFLPIFTVAETVREEEPVGKRPYEMVNAGRNADAHPAFVDFENLADWNVETSASEAVFRQSRRQQLWGDYVGHLSYKHLPPGNEQSADQPTKQSDKQPVFVRICPQEPMPIGKPFDSATLWIYGNNWDWIQPPEVPQVRVSLLFQDTEGEQVAIYLDRVRWKEWHLVHHKFQPGELARLGKNPQFVGIEINGGTNTEFAELFFDNLAFYQEELKPLEFAPRPKRPIALPEDQTIGTNTGPGFLPFPNCEETILPGAIEKPVLRTAPETMTMGGWKWESRNFSHYQCKGDFSSINVSCGNDDLQIVGGRLDFGVPESEVVSEMLSAEIITEGDEQVLCVKWRYTFHDKECLAKWTFHNWNNSLVVDVEAKGGLVRGVHLGKLSSLTAKEKPDGTPAKPVFIPVPFLTGQWANRPLVTMIPGNTDEERLPIFYLATIDHTRSNGTELFFGQSGLAGVPAGAGVKYLPKTDGTYNDCFERIFVTVSPKFADVLPNIPNPVSPWRHVTASRVWYPFPATNREQDYQYWKNMHRYGIRQMIINDHETGWRDGGESFTFRTYPAPGKGGDEGQLEYTKRLHALGYDYGPYNNYTDYSPVNEYWDEDWVTRSSNGQWRSSWTRCYNPKPQRAVEAEQKIAEIVQNKFHFNTAYCDVHTAVTPWDYVDLDARVPGAGTFVATFYAYGEIMLHQKQTWGGPVYSEGNNHWYYCGLADGNYAQDQAYFKRNYDLPWLVDFDLLKMHPLCNNFGMGSPDMFYSDEENRKPDAIDRFIAATLAFGHTGFLTPYGMHNAVKGYFLVQAIAERIGTQNVSQIRYADENGNLLPTEQALESGAYKLNRIEVTYEDGFTIRVNGNRARDWDDLPPHGFRVHDPTGAITAACQYVHGTRFDYIDSPDYMYADGRGHLRRFDKLLCDGPVVVLKNKTEPWEVIPIQEGPNPCKTFAFAMPDASVVVTSVTAIDKERNELGQADCRQVRRMLYIFPKEGVFSYLIGPELPTQAMGWAFDDLHYVVPGMCLFESGIKIPDDAVPGTIHWVVVDNGHYWYDFIVLPLCDFDAKYDQDTAQLTVTIRSNFPEEIDYTVSLKGIESMPITVPLKPDQKTAVVFTLEKPTQPGVRNIEIVATAKNDQNELTLSKPLVLTSEMTIREYPMPENFETGYAFRGGNRVPGDNKSGAYATRQGCTSGNVTKQGWGVHPPYIGGVGYTFMQSESILLPKSNNVQLTANVGIRDGGDASDGITYKVVVIADGQETEVTSVHHVGNHWSEITADLSPWSGKNVQLLLITDVGPNDDPSADWGCWADLRLCSITQELVETLSE